MLKTDVFCCCCMQLHLVPFWLGKDVYLWRGLSRGLLWVNRFIPQLSYVFKSTRRNTLQACTSAMFCARDWHATKNQAQAQVQVFFLLLFYLHPCIMSCFWVCAIVPSSIQIREPPIDSCKQERKYVFPKGMSCWKNCRLETPFLNVSSRVHQGSKWTFRGSVNESYRAGSPGTGRRETLY